MNYTITPTTLKEISEHINVCTASALENITSRISKFMDKFLNEVEEASFEGNRLIGIFDFDADGITSSLEAKTEFPDIEIHIPDRYIDGYGIPKDLSFLRHGDIVLLGDIGSSDIEGIRKIREITGRYPYIVDHHELPFKDSVSESDYNFMQSYPKMLNFFQDDMKNTPEYCTAGLFFQIAKYLKNANLLEQEKYDLCSMYNVFGSIADECPMNHKFDTIREDVRYGFNMIETVSLEKIAPAFGLFLSKTGLYDEAFMHTSAAQFKVNPVLNAPGRLGVEMIGIKDKSGGQYLFETLSSKEPIEKIIRKINNCISINEKRKELEAEAITDPNFLACVEHTLNQNSKLAICYMPDLNVGICGRMAQKLVEMTGVPSICLCGDKEHMRGSARNASGFPLMLSTCEQILNTEGINCGGHENAFGLSGTYEALTKATSSLHDIYKQIEPIKDITVDAITDIKDLSVMKLLALEPHGNDFPMPMVAIDGIASKVSEFAKGYGEIRLTEEPNIKFFGQNIQASKGERLLIIGNADISTFRNKTSTQINIQTIEKPLIKTINTQAELEDKKNVIELEHDMDEYDR